MANWSVILDIIHEADEGKFSDEINRHLQWTSVYHYTDDEDILVFDTSDGMHYMNELLKERMEIPKEDRYQYGEPYDGWYLEYAVGGDEFYTFTEEGFYCPNCDRWHNFNEYGPNNYHIWDGEILCDECIRENKNFAEDYINDIKTTYDYDSCDHCNTILSADQLEKMGWKKFNEDTYEVGMYGTWDDPKKIARQIWDKLGHETEILFDCASVNPFATYYNVWIKEVA